MFKKTNVIKVHQFLNIISLLTSYYSIYRKL